MLWRWLGHGEGTGASSFSSVVVVPPEARDAAPAAAPSPPGRSVRTRRTSLSSPPGLTRRLLVRPLHMLSALELAFRRKEDWQEFDQRVIHDAPARAMQQHITSNTTRLGRRDRLFLASVFIRDAVNRREPRFIMFQSKVARKLFVAHRSTAWKVLINTVSLVYCCGLLAFDVGQSWRETTAKEVVMWEAGLLFVLGIDIAAPIIYEGWATWRGPRLHQAQLVSFGFLVLDTCVTASLSSVGVPGLRPLRVVRPGYFLFINRASRNCVHAVVATLPALADLFIIFAIVLFVGTFFATAAFSRQNVAPDALASEPFGDSYDNVARSFATLLILIASAENYPDAHVVAVESRGGAPATRLIAGAFFPVVLVCGFFVLISVLIAIVFESYADYHSRYVAMEKDRERRALLAAFAMADISRDGTLSRVEFANLIRTHDPAKGWAEIEAMFSAVDADSDGKVNAAEFLCLCDHLVLHVRRDRPTSPPQCWGAYQHSPLAEAIFTLVNHRAFEALVIAMVTCSVVVLLVDVVSQDAGLSHAVRGLDVAIALAFVAEVALRVAAEGAGYFASTFNRVDTALVAAAAVTAVVAFVRVDGYKAPPELPSALIAVRASRVLRLLRLSFLVKRLRALRAITSTLASMCAARAAPGRARRCGSSRVPTRLACAAGCPCSSPSARLSFSSLPWARRWAPRASTTPWRVHRKRPSASAFSRGVPPRGSRSPFSWATTFRTTCTRP